MDPSSGIFMDIRYHLERPYGSSGETSPAQEPGVSVISEVSNGMSGHPSLQWPHMASHDHWRSAFTFTFQKTPSHHPWIQHKQPWDAAANGRSGPHARRPLLRKEHSHAPLKFNSSPLKNGGWKTILSYWGVVTFRGWSVKLQGRNERNSWLGPLLVRSHCQQTCFKNCCVSGWITQTDPFHIRRSKNSISPGILTTKYDAYKSIICKIYIELFM